MDFSKYLKKLQFDAKSDKNIDIEKQVVEFCHGIDFSDPENIAEAENYIAEFINDKLGRNVQVTREEAKLAHLLATKMALYDKGYGDTRVIYRPKKKDEASVGAYYDPTTRSLTFFDDNVCHPRYLLNPYGKSIEQGAHSRMHEFNHQLFVINHEVQHVCQFGKTTDDPTNLTSLDFQIQKQHTAIDFLGQ